MSTWRNLFVWVAIIFAIVMAILGISLPRSGVQIIGVISDFFDIMLPFLAVAALVNYLWKSCCCNDKQG
ncbi:MAG: hypothetical protein CMF39_00025 [Legionellaceae bacterium]|nr:hypothetical protein [Legionellaceae bacterium]